MSTRNPGGYGRQVFINCPFDDAYLPLFRAITFVIRACDYQARCALEAMDAGEIRMAKILRLIRGCRFGIHDISRTTLDPVSNLPRFNMPLELGLFLGAAHYGNSTQRRKQTLVLDVERFRYQKFLSDIAGQDKANPLATMLSLAMMFRYTFARADVADRIEAAVREVLRAGLRTGDIALPGEAVIGTRAMGDAVVQALRAQRDSERPPGSP